MIPASILDISHSAIFFKLKDFSGGHFKQAGLNAAGFIKLKTARGMLSGLERRHRIQPGKHKIIESSSGNLGIAFSLVCKVQGYGLSCIMDPNAAPLSVKFIDLHGGRAIQATAKDEHDGYLNARIRKNSGTTGS